MYNTPHSNKKLLILGGTQISKQILYAAKEMGLIVYVTDYNLDSPCKELADKSFSVSATDVDGVVNLIHKENINGVLTGYADVLLPAYLEICEKANLPCYANKIAIEITSDKKKFKDYCINFGVPVVTEYTLQDVESGNAQFPLVVKPVDNSGARGIYICHDSQDFYRYYPESLKYSKSGKVVIEKLMSCNEATIFYYLHNGEIYLLGIGDRWMYQQNEKLLKLPVGYTFPSKNLDNFIAKQDKDIKEMFKSLNMKEGMVFMQAFIDNDQYVIYEMGYRLTGSIEHHLFDKQYGFNHLKAIIDYSVGNNVDTTNLLKLNPADCCMANVSLLLDNGTISRYDGLSEVLKYPNIIHCHISHQVGSRIDDNIKGKLAQLGIRVLLLGKGRKDLLTSMDNVKNRLHVFSDKGDEMIIKDYSYKTICK